MNRITLLTVIISICITKAFADDGDAELLSSYTTSVGWVIKPGDKLTVGIGSSTSRTYAYIYWQPTKKYSYAVMPEAAGDELTIERIEKQENNKVVLDVTCTNNLFPANRKKDPVYKVNIESAIATGEIKVPKDRIARQSDGQNNSPALVADELIKLKKLKDEGVITEDEFQKQKQKLLNK